MTATLEEIEQEELKLEQDISGLKAQAAPETAEDDAAGGGGEPSAPPPEETAAAVDETYPVPPADPVTEPTPANAVPPTAPGAAPEVESIPEIFAADYALLKSEVHSLAKKIYGEAMAMEEAGKSFVLKLGGEIKHIFYF